MQLENDAIDYEKWKTATISRLKADIENYRYQEFNLIGLYGKRICDAVPNAFKLDIRPVLLDNDGNELACGDTTLKDMCIPELAFIWLVQSLSWLRESAEKRLEDLKNKEASEAYNEVKEKYSFLERLKGGEGYAKSEDENVIRKSQV